MSASQRVWNNTNSTTSGMRKEALRWGQGISSCIFWQVESTCLALDTRHSSTAKYFPDDDSLKCLCGGKFYCVYDGIAST